MQSTKPKETVTITAKNRTRTIELPLTIAYKMDSPSHVKCLTDDGYEVWYFNEQEAAPIGLITSHIIHAHENPVKTVNAWADNVISDIMYQENN